jgi:hypothetical protein
MGLLDGQLASAIYAGFKGKLLIGSFRQATVPASGALDSYGDPIDAGYVDTPCQGFADEYSAFYRAQAGIPDDSVKVCIFAKSMPGITPAKDDKVKLTQAGVATWYQVRSVATDPATALWTLESFTIPEPA